VETGMNLIVASILEKERETRDSSGRSCLLVEPREAGSSSDPRLARLRSGNDENTLEDALGPPSLAPPLRLKYGCLIVQRGEAHWAARRASHNRLP